VEVVLVNNRSSKKPLGSQDEIEGLAHGRLTDIVSPDQKCVAAKVDFAMCNTAKISDT
jgi:hypothetical protein